MALGRGGRSDSQLAGFPDGLRHTWAPSSDRERAMRSVDNRSIGVLDRESARRITLQVWPCGTSETRDWVAGKSAELGFPMCACGNRVQPDETPRGRSRDRGLRMCVLKSLRRGSDASMYKDHAACSTLHYLHHP